MKYLALFKDAWAHWSEDKCSRLGAALAYYTIFSIAPLLIIIFGVVGMVFGDKAPQQLMSQIQQFVGPTAAEAITGMITSSHAHGGGVIPTVVGSVTMLVGAAGLFVALQDALNTIWGVAPDPKAGWGVVLRNRAVSFLMVLVSASVLFASLLASAVIEGMAAYLGSLLPMPGWAMEAINLGISFAVVTLLFAMMYRVLPDVEIAWGDVWVGAAFTSLLFVLGKFALGLYLGRSTVGSAYGAAGSLVVLLVWVYYASQIFLFGAEYTQVYSNKYGSHFKTSAHAVPVGTETLAEEGIPPREVYDAASDEMLERHPERRRKQRAEDGAETEQAPAREPSPQQAKTLADWRRSSADLPTDDEQAPAIELRSPEAYNRDLEDAARHIRGDV